MKFTALEIPDVRLIETPIWRDERGFFLETYHQDKFSVQGIPAAFVQDNQSCSQKGVVRGLHYQVPPKAQAKLVRVLRGKIFDVCVDLRKSSKTFGKHVAVTLGEEDRRILYVPAGFAHGFLALEDRTEVAYKVSALYSPEHERGLLWNDPELGIPWPVPGGGYVLSEKDQRYPELKGADLFP